MNRGVPITVAALALALLAGDATAQHRTTATWRPPTTTWRPPTTTWQRQTAIWQRPNPQANRPMGVPASVQPSGHPLPAPPGCWNPCRPPGVAAVYFYPVPIPYSYSTVHGRRDAYDPNERPRGAQMAGDPPTRRPPVMTIVEPAASPTVFAPDRATGCAVVEIRMAGGPWRSPVPLPSLGAATRDALFRVLAERLANGQQIPLVTLNGTQVVLASGPGISGLSVEPCDLAQSPSSGGAQP